jgi:predicted CoA-binding protein
MSDAESAIRRLLDAQTVAVVGCSDTPGKAAHDVPAYLKRQGYDIVPVNPHRETVLGRRAYDDVRDVEESVDVVDVFRPSEEVSGVVDAVLERVDERDDVWGLWLQLGIRDDDAAARARDAGLTVVQDRCFKVEHGRRVG